MAESHQPEVVSRFGRAEHFVSQRVRGSCTKDRTRLARSPGEASPPSDEGVNLTTGTNPSRLSRNYPLATRPVPFTLPALRAACSLRQGRWMVLLTGNAHLDARIMHLEVTCGDWPRFS